MIDQNFNFKGFRKDANAALESVGKKYGLKIQLTNITYEQTSFRCTMKAQEVGSKTPEELKYELEQRYDKSLPKLHEVVLIGGKAYRIDGWKKRASKLPILATEVLTAKQYVFPVFSVRRHVKITV